MTNRVLFCLLIPIVSRRFAMKLGKLIASLAVPVAVGMLSLGFAYAGEVRIGLMCPLTGKWASEGQDMRQIVTLLVDDVNKAGGINGDTIDLIVEDDAGDPRTAALAAQKLASAGVIAVIGTYGSAVTEASQNILDESEIVQIATGSTNIRLTEKGMKSFFRTCPRDDEQARVAAKVITSKGYKKVAILHDNSSYAKGLADETLKELKKTDTNVVFFNALTPSERDYTAILTKLKASEPDLIFYTGYYNDAGTLLRQKKEMNWDVDMLGGDATNNTDLVKIAGKTAAAGFLFISPPAAGDFDSPEARTFFARYQKEFNSLPSSVWSVLAGDAFTSIADALKKAGKNDAESLTEALKKSAEEPVPGLTGPLAFDEKGDRIGDLYRLYVVAPDGSFTLTK